MAFLHLSEIHDFGSESLTVSILDFYVLGVGSYCFLMSIESGSEVGFSIIVEVDQGNLKGGVFVDSPLEGLCPGSGSDIYMCYSPSGQIIIRNSNGFIESTDIKEMGYTYNYGCLTSLSLIDGRVLATGMARQVYLKVENGWDLISREIIDESLDKYNFSGFFDLVKYKDGFLASGVSGETWVYEKKTWRNVDTPFNVDVDSLSNLRTDAVVLGGQQGLLWLCDVDKWFDLSQYDISGNISAVICFSNFIFIVYDGALLYKTIGKDSDFFIRLESIDEKVIKFKKIGEFLFVLTVSKVFKINAEIDVEVFDVAEVLRPFNLVLG